MPALFISENKNSKGSLTPTMFFFGIFLNFLRAVNYLYSFVTLSDGIQRERNQFVL